MALQKLTYTDGVTVIPASNLNAIQDAIIALENKPDNGVSDDLKVALLQLASKVAYIDDQGQQYYDDLYDALYPPKTLVSITAVFTQGSTVVYDNASLDSLKTMLAVTAHYDDNTTAIVPDNAYTLSGTLTPGTSTVTVTYNSKTTTFTVNVTAAPTLSSISAVYTQSGTVYDTDTLDSLKDDLVVTAHYSDSSTQTVPSADYTLSGTLTVGTSTITVSYGGKTTSFNVTVSQGIVPSGYTAYDYVAYTGSNKSSASESEMILTKVFDDLASVKIDFDFMPLKAQTDSTAHLVGGKQGDSSGGTSYLVAIYCRTDTKRVSAFSHGTAIGIDNIPTIAVNSKSHVTLDPGSASPSTLTVDASSQTGAWTSSNTINQSLAICGTMQGGNKVLNYFAGIGILRIYDTSDTKIGEYVPCVRDADSVIGLYDTVTETFYTAATLDYVTIGGASCEYSVGSWGV